MGERLIARQLALLAAVLLGSAPIAGHGGTAPGGAAGRPPFRAPAAAHVEGELLVKFRAGTPLKAADRARGEAGARILRRFRTGAEHWRLGPGQRAEDAVEWLRRNPQVQYAELNHILSTHRVPNDPRYPEQYALHNTGQAGGTPASDISAQAAWDVTVGLPDVIVAVIDTGVDATHPDLAANIYVNPEEIPGNAVDDDADGFIDDVSGWDFFNDDNSPSDDHGHGTHVAGIIGAVTDNGVGIAGVAWRVSLLPLKFLDATGRGPESAAMAAIDYATTRDVDIINASWGNYQNSQALSDSIRAAGDTGVLFVAAAGNDGLDTDLTPHFPSSYDLPNVVSVAATDNRDARWFSSNHGRVSVDLGAPGVSVLSTIPGGYALLSGTSMAAPHVSGAAALIRSTLPDVQPTIIRQMLIDGSDPITALDGVTVSGGRLDAARAVAVRDEISPGSVSDLAATNPTSGSVVLTWTATGDDGQSGAPAGYDIRYATHTIDTGNFELAMRAAVNLTPHPAGQAETVEVGALAAGTLYFFALRAVDDWANVGPVSNTVSATTLPPPTLATSPATFSATLPSGGRTAETLVVQNVGQGTLDWSLATAYGGSAATGQLEAEGFTGPDAFGYRSVDSDAAGGPAFDWIDISATGTVIESLVDDEQLSEPIPLGFDFPFYGQIFSSVRVCTNGFLTFVVEPATYENRPLPSPAAPPFLIAPFWDDLNFDGTARAAWASDGRRFTVQYTDVPRYEGPGTYTFQVSLEDTGQIRFRYMLLTGTTTSATVGVQDGSQRIGLQIAFDEPYLHDALAIALGTDKTWLSSKPSRGRLYAGERRDVAVNIDAGTLVAGDYTAALVLRSNDPQRQDVSHPLTLSVTGAPSLSVAPPLLDFGAVPIGGARTLDLEVINPGNGTLTVTSATSNDDSISADPIPLTVPGRASRRLMVTYAPTRIRNLNSNLTVRGDVSPHGSAMVDLAGRGELPPVIGVAPPSLQATVAEGGVAATTVTVSNSGSGPLAFSTRVTLSAGLSATEGMFEILSPAPRPMAVIVGDPLAAVIYARAEVGPGFYKYTAATNRWDRLADAPTHEEVSNAGALVEGKVFLNNPMANVLDVYDIALDRWRTIAHPLPLDFGGIASDERYLYFFSAQRGRRYDPRTRETVDLAPPPPGALYTWTAYLDGAVYAADRYETQFVRYDIATNAWIQLAPLPKFLVGGATIDPLNRAFYTAGLEGTEDLYRFDVASGTWSISRNPHFAAFGGRVAWLPGAHPAIYLHAGGGATAFARAVIPPSLLSVVPETAVVPPSSSVALNVRLDSRGFGPGEYAGALEMSSNDPARPFLTVPANLVIVGAPRLRLEPVDDVIESQAPFDSSGLTVHNFPYIPHAGIGATLDLLLEGDFSWFREFADVRIDGRPFARVRSDFVQSNCQTYATSFHLGPAQLADYADDSAIQVRVQNDREVEPRCSTNRHLVRFTTVGVDPTVGLDFGTLDPGARREIRFLIRNTGSVDLHLTSVDAAPAEFWVAPAGAVVPPGRLVEVVAAFSSATPGSFTGALTITADDPQAPVTHIPLTAVSRIPARLGLDPAAITAATLRGTVIERSLTLMNTGDSPLEYTAARYHRIGAGEPTPVCPLTQGIVGEQTTGKLTSVALDTGAAKTLLTLPAAAWALATNHADTTMYATQPLNSAVTVIDRLTRTLSTIQTGVATPMGIAISADDRTAYIGDGWSGTLYAVDLTTGATVPIAAGLGSIGWIDLDRAATVAYTTDIAGERLLSTDILTGTVTELAGGFTQVGGLAFIEPERRIYVAAASYLWGYDFAAGQIVGYFSPLPAYTTAVARDLSNGAMYMTMPGAGLLAAVERGQELRLVRGGLQDPFSVTLQGSDDCFLDLIGPTSGTIPPGGTATFRAKLAAYAENGSVARAEIELFTNDPLAPRVVAPVTFTVDIDSDADGVVNLSDCGPLDAGVWALPGEATRLDYGIGGALSLSWSAPSSTGTSRPLTYDVLRSERANNFVDAGSLTRATCLARLNPANTFETDPAVPQPRGAFFYLVRARNFCGTGPAGFSSNGLEILARACP